MICWFTKIFKSSCKTVSVGPQKITRASSNITFREKKISIILHLQNICTRYDDISKYHMAVFLTVQLNTLSITQTVIKNESELAG